MFLEILQQTPVDSLTTGLGAVVGTTISVKLAVVLSFVVKFCTDAVLKIKGLHYKLPTKIKPFVAFGVAMGLVALNEAGKRIGMPEIVDLNSINAVVAWLAGMGIHSLGKAVIKKS